MAGLYDQWKNAKKALEKQVADVKKKGGMNPKQIEAALKSFDQGLGPLLTKVGTAYKANKGKDVQKHAEAAIKVAEKYLETVNKISNERGSGARITLKALIAQLTTLKDKGMTAPNYF